MPCTFDPNTRRQGSHWRSADSNLRPESGERFHIITDNHGGGCGYCRSTQSGIIWASISYVLCLSCAVRHFNAPDLRIVAPELFDPDPESTDDDDDVFADMPANVITKIDKDFDPSQYGTYTHTSDLSGKSGCSGYKCQTFAAPLRTIPANTQFMLGTGSRGCLCMACFAKLKTKFDALPDRDHCHRCDRTVLVTRLRDTVDDGKVCNNCVTEYYMNAPDTDGGLIARRTAVFMTVSSPTPARPAVRRYASLRYAQLNWFMGAANQWFLTQEEADRGMFEADIIYRDERVVSQRSSLIFSYGTNVIKMHGFPSVTNKDDLCFGVELEMQPNRNHGQADVVRVLGGKFVTDRPYILCSDSSLGAAGVELITLPYKLSDHQSNKYMPWAKVLADLRAVAQSGQNTQACGMHVHINRRALSHLQMGKMLVIINAPEMQELVVTIAQRNETSYARRYFKKVAEGGKIIGSHGDALNMSNQKGTCELRIFRGNLRYERVMKNIEFTHALCTYAGEQSVQKVHIPEAMYDWIRDNKTFYPHLVKFLAEEYKPTKAYARTAARLRTTKQWEDAAHAVNVEPTEGDI